MPAAVKEAQLAIPYNLDAWDGYMVECETVLETARATDSNLVVQLSHPRCRGNGHYIDTVKSLDYQLLDSRSYSVVAFLGTGGWEIEQL